MNFRRQFDLDDVFPPDISEDDAAGNDPREGAPSTTATGDMEAPPSTSLRPVPRPSSTPLTDPVGP